MKMDLKGKYSFKDKLYNEAKNIGIELTDNMISKFEEYKNMIVEWNEKINLTSITKEEDIIMKHFIDCLEVVKYINQGEKIVDIGTGAGFPGIVIAIFFEGKVNITLLDALNKRLIFLQEVINKLTLVNVEIVHARAEEFAHNEEYREKFDVVVSRAVAPLNVLLEYDIAYLKVGGKALLLKGNNALDEIKEADNALKILKCDVSNMYNYNYNVNDEVYNRSIIEIKKREKCSSKYPRTYGKIKKNPLV